MSDKGIAFLARHEGCRRIAYRDPVGIWTVGIGCTRWFDGRPVKPHHQLHDCEADAYRLLDLHLPHYEAPVRAAMPGENQKAFDAATSFCFNIGRDAFRRSTFARRWQAGDISGAAEALTWYAKATVKPGQRFPSGAEAHKDTVVIQRGHRATVKPGGPLDGCIAVRKTKFWLSGLVKRRAAEKKQFLAAYNLTDAEKKTEKPMPEPRISSAADLLRHLDQPISMIASCTHKRAIGAMREIVGEYLYPDIADTAAKLPPPEKYRITATLDDDYPPLDGLTVSATAAINSDTDLDRARAQYAAAESLAKQIEARIIAAGGSLA